MPISEASDLLAAVGGDQYKHHLCLSEGGEGYKKICDLKW